MMMQSSTTMTAIFLDYSVFNEPQYLGKHRRNFHVFLRSNIWGVDIPFTLTIFLICTRWNEGNTKKSECITQPSTQLCTMWSAFTRYFISFIISMCGNTAHTKKHSLNLGWKGKILGTVTLKVWLHWSVQLTTASLSGGGCPGCPGNSTFGTASP